MKNKKKDESGDKIKEKQKKWMIVTLLTPTLNINKKQFNKLETHNTFVFIKIGAVGLLTFNFTPLYFIIEA